MSKRAQLAALLALGALASLSLDGCQSYEAKPLDLDASSAAWLARSPDHDTVRAFAARLAHAEAQADRGTEPPFDPSDGLTLHEAEPVALVFNRELRVARLEANVTSASAEFAGLWEDPVAGVDLEYILGGVANPWIVAATVGITLPISGRLEAEQARASAAYAAKLRDIAEMEWSTRATLREVWFEWSAQVIRAELASELVRRLRDVADLAERQEKAGVLSRIDASVFVVKLAGGEADVAVASARAAELELQLRDLLGLAPEAPVRLMPLLAFAPRATDEMSLRDTMASDNATLAAARSAYDVAEESLHLEIRKQYPDLTIGPGYKNEDADSRLLLGLSMPVPLWNRNQRGVAEALAHREVARARFETTYEQLASQLARALTRYRAGKQVREMLEARLVPLADAQAADVRHVASLGRVDPLLLLEAIHAQHDAKVRLADSRAAESIAAARVDELAGPPPRAAEAVDQHSEGGSR